MVDEMAELMRGHERARKFPRAFSLLIEVKCKPIHLDVPCASDCSRPRRTAAMDEMAELMSGHERARMFSQALEPLIDPRIEAIDLDVQRASD